MRKGSRHLLQLINDVLDMSKIEAGRLDLDLEDLDRGFALGEVAPVPDPRRIVEELRELLAVPVAAVSSTSI